MRYSISDRYRDSDNNSNGDFDIGTLGISHCIRHCKPQRYDNCYRKSHGQCNHKSDTNNFDGDGDTTKPDRHHFIHVYTYILHHAV